MKPPFATVRGLAGFAMLVLFFLALPWLSSWLPPQDRSEAYVSGMTTDRGPFPWVRSQIFERRETADMVFMGSSLVLGDIQARLVQQRLSEATGRKTLVRTIAWNGSGYDALYFIAKDLLARRRVRMLVIDDNPHLYDGPSIHAASWFRWGDSADDLQGLPWRAQCALYGSAVLGAPRALLGRIRPNRPTSPFDWFIGANRGFVNGGNRVYSTLDGVADFLPDPPRSSLVAPEGSEWFEYGPSNRGIFEFGAEPLGPYHAPFPDRLLTLCEEHQTRLVVLHLPGLEEYGRKTVPVRGLSQAWFDSHRTVTLLGDPAARLFAGLTAQEHRALYYDSIHLNARGQDHLTPRLIPGLIRVYEALEKPNAH